MWQKQMYSTLKVKKKKCKIPWQCKQLCKMLGIHDKLDITCFLDTAELTSNLIPSITEMKRLSLCLRNPVQQKHGLTWSEQKIR